MITNHFKSALRQIRRNASASILNILGLTIGLTCLIFISLYIRHELSYDKVYPNSDKISRIVKDFVDLQGTKLPDATTPPALLPAMLEEFPEIESAVRIFPNWGDQYLIQNEEVRFYEDKVFQVDSTFFSVFNIDFLSGTPLKVLSDKSSIVLTRSFAIKLFGTLNCIEKQLLVGYRRFGNDPILLKVTGVIDDTPPNSHFAFSALLPIQLNNIDSNWGMYNFYTYIRLKDNAHIESLEPKLQPLFKKHNPEINNIFYSQSLTSIHLKSNLRWELQPPGSIQQVKLLIGAAILITILLGVNYINLSTATSTLRGKEIAVRKISGSTRTTLLNQLFTESMTVIFIALIFSCVIVALILPVLNEVTQRQLVLFDTSNYGFILGLFLLIIFMGLLISCYPNLMMAGFKPVPALKGQIIKATGTRLRNILVVVQFAISSTLIIISAIAITQVNYLKSLDLGFEKEQLIILPNRWNIAVDEGLKNKFTQIPGVVAVGSSSHMVGSINRMTRIDAKGIGDPQVVNFTFVDYDYLEAMQMKILEGRNFSRDFPTDNINSIIVNETAVKQLGLLQPVIGQKLIWSRTQDTTIYYQIIGVVKDFHFSSFHIEIKPFALMMGKEFLSNFIIKAESKNIQAVVADIGQVWNEIVPDRPFEFYFLNQSFASLYQADENFKTVLIGFSIISIAIACIGLFALISFSTERRVKEIGIRKVLGATVTEIVLLLIQGPFRSVLLAYAVAVPFAILIVEKWLQTFAYKTSIPAWVIVLAGAGTIIITISTIGIKTWIASRTSPIKSLRAE